MVVGKWEGPRDLRRALCTTMGLICICVAMVCSLYVVMCSGCLACVAAAVHRSVDSNLANQLEEQLAMLVVIQGGPFLVPLNRLSLSLSISLFPLSAQYMSIFP